MRPATTFFSKHRFKKLRLLLTRPRKDAESLEILLKNMGIQSIIEPLLDICVFDGPDIECHAVAALAMTSANGVRAFAARSQNRQVPVYAVGDATARIAKDNGFPEIYSAAGTVCKLATLIINSLPPDAGIVLHPAATRVAGDLEGYLREAGFSYQREIIYEAVPAKHLSPSIVTQIQAGEIDGVVLFSPRTGATFKILAEKAGLIDALTSLRAYCLSQAVADTITSISWLDVCTAENPNQASFLKLLDTY